MTATEKRRFMAALRAASPAEQAEAMRILAESTDPGDVRAWMTSGGAHKLFRALLGLPGGRKAIAQQRAKALQVLRTTKDWRDAGYAAYLLQAIDAALAAHRSPARNPCRASTQRLTRIAALAETACHALAAVEWTSRIPYRDLERAQWAARDIRQLASEGAE